MSTIDSAAIETRFVAAESAVTEERRRVDDELGALENFAAQVREVETDGTRAANAAPAIELSADDSDGGLRAVRSAYATTFMAVPHYEDDYDEPYGRSLAAEFGHDLAAALVGGDRFTPACKRALLSAVADAVASREALVEALEREQRSVTEAGRVLVPMAEELVEIRRSTRSSPPMGVLDAHDARLGVLAEKCDQLLDDRQSTIVSQRRSLTLPVAEADVPSYVYHDVDGATYPVLGALADCLERLDALRREVETNLERHTSAGTERESHT